VTNVWVALNLNIGKLNHMLSAFLYTHFQ